MSIAIKHFERTIALGHMVGIDFEKPIRLQVLSGQDEVKRVSKEVKKCIKLYKGPHSKKIKEIYAIEKEKLKLRDSEEAIERIFKKEAVYTMQREKLLSLNFNELTAVEFMVNPLVDTYPSDWKWLEREPFEKLFDLKTILNTKKEDHYFLFEKTGTFDALVDSNISEFYLTEYQYFLLQLFEEAKTVKSALSDFSQAFEITNVQEEKEFFFLAEKLLKELIFRRFIVVPDGTIV